MRIPILDLKPELAKSGNEYVAAIEKVVRSGQFIMGENVHAFEKEAAEFLGVRHAVAMNSGTDALLIGLRALGIQPGDEVLVPAFSFFATAEVVSLAGATPVFCDIDSRTFNLDPSGLEQYLTSKTKAVIPVHLFGQPAEMAAIMEFSQKHDLKVLEDAAQAFGATYQGKRAGTIGNAGAYSFFPSKNLGAFGDGGMLVTQDDRVADQAKLLRIHGSRVRYHHEAIGYASRLDEIQAAILRIKLRDLDSKNAGRIQVAGRYSEALKAIPGIEAPFTEDNRTSIFHQYTIRVKNNRRDALHNALSSQGIGTMIYYPIPLHQTEIYRTTFAGKAVLPRCEAAAQEALSLPIWPEMESATQLEVVKAISGFSLS